ncbi:GNAT family N-acetyltransferase [Leifsonia kafniensis]|uniref:GNAT family N-acetyltransferase n=1 Tax=Leifsonia kafniensis TaxID=475957 RepID=A0ABP7KPH6_9MICO
MVAIIRRAEPADVAELAEVAAATFVLACPPGTKPASISAFIAAHLSPKSFATYLADPARDIRVAVRDGNIVGYTMLVFGEPTDPDVTAALTLRPTVELSKVYLLGEHHGVGLAATLMTATLDAARARGASGAWLGVNNQNSRAIRFYEKSGFAIVGAKTFQVGDQIYNDHVMERPL